MDDYAVVSLRISEVRNVNSMLTIQFLYSTQYRGHKCVNLRNF